MSPRPELAVKEGMFTLKQIPVASDGQNTAIWQLTAATVLWNPTISDGFNKLPQLNCQQLRQESVLRTKQRSDKCIGVYWEMHLKTCDGKVEQRQRKQKGEEVDIITYHGCRRASDFIPNACW